MMRNPEQTIGNLIDKQGVAFISSVDEEGFPNTKAMLPPREEKVLRCFTFLPIPHLCVSNNIKVILKPVFISVISVSLEG